MALTKQNQYKINYNTTHTANVIDQRFSTWDTRVICDTLTKNCDTLPLVLCDTLDPKI